MGFLMFLSRKISLQHRESDLTYQLTSISSKLQDYTRFASILSQDTISLNDISEMPASIFQNGLANLNYINGAAAQIAQQNMAQAAGTGMFNGNQNLQMIAHQKMYENARKELQKQLRARLNEEEKSLQSRKTRLDAELTIVQQELEKMDQQIGRGIKNQLSNFGIQG